MGNVVAFRDSALIQLRQKVAALDEANADLLAFARGHSGAVAQIHEAALAAMDAECLDHLIHIVTQEWPVILGLDAVALALVSGDTAVRASANGLQRVDVTVLEGRMDGPTVIMRGIETGDPVFGPAAALVRAEALIRLDMPEPLPKGLLALGSRQGLGFDGGHGSELLSFLGAVVSRMIARWLI